METEKRLIDAYALMDCIRDSKRHNPHDDPTVAQNHMFEHDHFMKMVSLAPTVDAVEVVHEQWVRRDFGLAYECPRCGHAELYLLKFLSGLRRKDGWRC